MTFIPIHVKLADLNKKKTIRKVLVLGGWLLVICGITTLLVAANRKDKEHVCKEILVGIKGNGGKFYVEKEDVLKLMEKTANGPLLQQGITSINLRRLEDGLKTNPWIKNAELYFAMLNNQVVGYLKLNFGQAQTELKDDKALEIERIYVLQEFHGKKIGQLLYEKAIQIAKQANMDYVWLGVWEENERAINFYKKNGFVAFDKHLFKLGDDEQTDIMMKLQLER